MRQPITDFGGRRDGSVRFLEDGCAMWVSGGGVRRREERGTTPIFSVTSVTACVAKHVVLAAGPVAARADTEMLAPPDLPEEVLADLDSKRTAGPITPEDASIASARFSGCTNAMLATATAGSK